MFYAPYVEIEEEIREAYPEGVVIQVFAEIFEACEMLGETRIVVRTLADVSYTSIGTLALIRDALVRGIQIHSLREDIVITDVALAPLQAILKARREAISAHSKRYAKDNPKPPRGPIPRSGIGAIKNGFEIDALLRSGYTTRIVAMRCRVSPMTVTKVKNMIFAQEVGAEEMKKIQWRNANRLVTQRRRERKKEIMALMGVDKLPRKKRGPK